MMPTAEPYLDPTPEDHQLLRHTYSVVKLQEPTASSVADTLDLDIGKALSILRILENFQLIRHRADSLGVIRWQWRPGNRWEGPEPPF